MQIPASVWRVSLNYEKRLSRLLFNLFSFVTAEEGKVFNFLLSFLLHKREKKCAKKEAPRCMKTQDERTRKRKDEK